MKKYFTTSLFLFIGFLGFAQTGSVGVGTNAPLTKLDINGDLALREGTAIGVLGANPAVVVALSATDVENSFYRITGIPTGTMTLNSIANGADGQIITFVNATTIKLQITNTNSADGILTAGALTQVISPNGSVTIQYSATAFRWFIINSSGSTLVDWLKATTADEPAISTDNQYVTGNVGLGDFSGPTSTPAERLEVLNGNAQITSIANGNLPSLNFYSGSAVTKNSNQKARINFWEPNSKGTWGTYIEHFDDDGNFCPSRNAGALLNHLILGSVKAGTYTPIISMNDGNTYTGRVGIGTTDPYTRLDVKGDIYTTIHGSNDQNNAAELGSRYIGMKSGTIADGFTGMKTEVGQFGSNASGAFTNNGSRITFQTWGNSISTSRDVMTINEFGEIFGKFRQSTVHNFNVNGYQACIGCDKIVWFPSPGGDAADDNPDNHTYYKNIFIAPYSGRIVAIYLSVDNTSSNVGKEVQNARFVFNNTATTMSEDGSLTGNSTLSGTYTVLANGAGAIIAGNRFTIDQGAKIVWKEARDKSTFSFNQGDQVAIGVSGDYIEDNDYQITVVWEYNIQD